MSRHLFKLLAPCLLVVFACLSALAQSSTATLSGTVEDQNGAVLPGVTISIENVGTRMRRIATTNDSGSFTVPLLPPGEYTVLVEREGFTRVQLTNIVLNVGDQKAVQVQLKVGDVASTVEVRPDQSLVETSPTVGTVVDRQFVQNIPLNGRSFQSLIALTPGVVQVPATGSTNSTGQFSINGQRASANAFVVDGVSANFGTAPGNSTGSQISGNLPSLTAFGSTQGLVSVDALEEFKIQTSTYSAEFGRQPGGQISIVTRSGTNDFHGSVFDYIRNDVFDANDWFANRAGQPRPPMRQNDFGGTLGGPVFLPNIGDGGPRWYNGRNRTFFFFSYEGLRLRLPTFALTNVPSLMLRQQAPAAVQPILNAFPLPNGRNLGNGLAEFTASYSSPSTLDATGIRIDHTFNDRITLFGRYNYAPSRSQTRTGSNLSTVRSSDIRTKTLTLGLTASLSSGLVNEFKINFSDNDGELSLAQDNFGGSVPLPRSVLIPNQFESSSAQGNAILQFPGLTVPIANTPAVSFTNGFYVQRQVNIVDNLSYVLGAHRLKFGIDYRRLNPTIAVNSYVNIPQFLSAQDVLNSRASTAIIRASLPSEPLYTNFSAFGQDTWMLSRRLTLNYGLRWEVNPPPSEANGNLPLAVAQISNLSTMQLASRDTKLWKTTYDNFAPRLGIAYQLRQDTGWETVIRGGFGLFYDIGDDFSVFSSFPFAASRTIQNETFPLIPGQVVPRSLPIQSGLTTPYDFLNAFDPALRLPYTLQWNVAIEQSLGQSQVFTLSYVGAAGRRLLQQRQLNLSPINPLFTTITLTTNEATSEYNALQAQFQRRLSHGLQALVSYTWSHAIDEDSASNTARMAQRGNASFDIRHNFSAAVTYDLPSPKWFHAANIILDGWSIDATIHAQSAFPVDIIARTFTDAATGDLVNVRPNLISGVPIYIEDSSVPGGKKINRAAFSVPAVGPSGNLGRNIIRGLPVWQVDFALRRQFKLTERLNLQLRAEAFNLFNHPNFGAIQTSLTAANFGEATNMLNRQLGGLNQLYQVGGPRSLQFALKLQF